MKRKFVLHATSVLVVLALAGTAQADFLASYDSEVPAAAGNADAADPASQGWTCSQGTSVWVASYDSGDGGWRTMDATGSTYAYCQYDLSAQNIAAMSGGWTLSTTLAIDSSAIQSDGDMVADYYLPPNQSRQNNISIWIEDTVGDYRYIVKIRTDENGDLLAYDGADYFQLTTDGSGYNSFKTVDIVYDGLGAKLCYEGQEYAIGTSGSAGVDRLIFGAVSSGGQGSAVWNSYTLTPEPAGILLLGIGAAIMLRRR